MLANDPASRIWQTHWTVRGAEWRTSGKDTTVSTTASTSTFPTGKPAEGDPVPARPVRKPGRSPGRPSLDELLLEEAARVVKFEVGDKVMHIDRDRALLPRLPDVALQGNAPAIQLVTERLRRGLEVSQMETPTRAT